VYVDEPGSRLAKDYFHGRAPARYTTPFCFYEALNILKAKWLYQGKISDIQYRKSASDLVVWYASIRHSVTEFDLTSRRGLKAVREISERHSLDFSDAFQIVSVKFGPYSRLVDRSQTLLITADRALAAAARAEGVLVWDMLNEPEP
jgi:predicted nucleic acid-binding protein